MSPVNLKVNSVHINPKFASAASLSNAATSNKVIVNPNFASRALPSLPPGGSSTVSKVHINPKKFFIDAYKTNEYEEAIKNAVVDSKKVVVLVNPQFQHQKQQEEKHMYVEKKKIPEEEKSKTSPQKLIGDNVYAVTTTTIKKVSPPPPPPPKPVCQTATPTSLNTINLISVQGVKYSISNNGRKLCRVDTEEKATKVLIRTRNSMIRQSINTIIKSQTRSKQYCMFYNKFGKCNKRDKGICPYIHDAGKVAVCRKFLHGICVKDSCFLSHKVPLKKMPSCKFFLEGLCTRDNCQYRHVNVNAEFLKGFCSATPGNSVQKKKARLRYYDAVEEKKKELFGTGEMTKTLSSSSTSSSEYEARRQRILKKVEATETGIAKVEKNTVDLDDSRPYEEIEEDEIRPPLGKLPSFISLSKYTSSDEDQEEAENKPYEERLI